MNSSGERVAATSWNSGRSARRPTPTRTARASAAWARVISSVAAQPPVSFAPSTPMVNRIGATARSWKSRMAKLARPAGALSRRRSTSTGTTMAVEESARARPMRAAGAGSSPSSAAAPPIARAERVTCREPRPKMSRRRVRRRSQDSSMPIMNRRNTTPNSARWLISSRLLIVTQRKPGPALDELAEAVGPEQRPDPEEAEHRADRAADGTAARRCRPSPGRRSPPCRIRGRGGPPFRSASAPPSCGGGGSGCKATGVKAWPAPAPGRRPGRPGARCRSRRGWWRR